MMVLAVDTSGESLLAGIASESKVLAEYNGEADRSHSEKIIEVIDGLLRSAVISPNKLDALAVTTGPGSFTGLRVGISTVLGLTQAWGTRILAMGNMRLLRLYFASENPQPILVTHCRGNEFYVSNQGEETQLLPANSILSGSAGRAFAGPGVARLADLAAQAGGSIMTVTPATWNGGQFSSLVARNADKFEALNPVSLDVNYFLKSQPEQRRDRDSQAVTVDDMQQDDLEAVMRIEQSSFSDPWDETNFVADMENPGVIALAGRIGETCVGYASCIALDSYGYVANIAVDEKSRSAGVGRAIMDELKKRLAQKGIDEIVLDVRASNLRAIQFYERYGFTIITRRKGFYTKPPEDSFTMLMSFGK